MKQVVATCRHGSKPFTTLAVLAVLAEWRHSSWPTHKRGCRSCSDVAIRR